MNLLIERRQKKLRFGRVGFSLIARVELDPEEDELVTRYRVRKVVLVPGDTERDLKRAAFFAALGAVIVTPLLVKFLGADLLGTIPTLALVFGVLGWLIYHQIREDVRIGDLLGNGRRFTCTSVLTLVKKEKDLIEMAVVFRWFLEVMKTWNQQEVLVIEQDRERMDRIVGALRAAA